MKLSIQKRSRLRLSLIAGALVSLMAAGAAQAQEQSMEERLRTQLRSVTGQLQQVQNELAQIKATGGAVPAAKPAPAPDAEAMRAELAQSRQQLGREREARSRRDAEVLAAQQQAKEATDKANAQVLQFRGAYEELLKMARASEVERQRLTNDALLHKTSLAQCEAKNQQLYALGQEVLQAYEKLDLNTLISARQPFASQSRVKYEELAQQYGDKLYQGKFDARAVSAPPPTESVSSFSAVPDTRP